MLLCRLPLALSALVSALLPCALGTSIKMDYLTMTQVRTDPITNPTSLSPHVHTFFGPLVAAPETTYEDMRAATAQSGLVEENKSLYWYPAIYRVQNGVYTLSPTWFHTAYYVWQTGQATAFPDGFNMIAGYFPPEIQNSRVKIDCDGDDTVSYFPTKQCAELEMAIVFPECWNGVDLDSEDHFSHVAYTTAYDDPCPDSHPVKLPQIHVYTRINNYPGGEHVFADGSTRFHADYFSGWNATQLQEMLDGCQNDGESAQPDMFCEDYLTYAVTKTTGVQSEDDYIYNQLLGVQPVPAFDPTTITDETITGITSLPSGPAPAPSPSPSPTSSSPIIYLSFPLLLLSQSF